MRPDDVMGNGVRVMQLPPTRRIAAEVSVSPTTISRVLKRHGLNKLKSLEPAKPMHRDESDHPREMCTTT